MRSLRFGLFAALLTFGCHSASPEPNAPQADAKAPASTASAAPSNAKAEEVAELDPHANAGPTEVPEEAPPPAPAPSEAPNADSASDTESHGPGRLAVEPRVAYQPKVRVGELKVSDASEDLARVKRAIRIRTGEYRACYEKGLDKNRDLEGRVLYRFDIQSDGSLARLQAQESSLFDEAVLKCMPKELSQVRFDARERKNVTVELPVLFAP